MQEFISVATPYNTAANRTPWRVFRNVTDGSTPDVSDSGTSDVDGFPSPTPPSVFNWNVIIGNIRQNNTTNFRETSELDDSIDRSVSNYSNAPSVVSQKLRDEFSVSSRRGLFLQCGMNVAAKTNQPMELYIFSHGIPNIDTLNEKSGTWSAAASSIRMTQNITHESASDHAVGQVTVIGAAVGYRE